MKYGRGDSVHPFEKTGILTDSFGLPTIPAAEDEDGFSKDEPGKSI